MVGGYFLLIVSVAATTAAVHSTAVVRPPPCQAAVRLITGPCKPVVGSTCFAAGRRWSCSPGTTFCTDAVTTTTIASEVSARRRPIAGRFIVGRKSWTECWICRLWYWVRWVRRGRSKPSRSCPIRSPAVDGLSGVWGVSGWTDALTAVWGGPLGVAVNWVVDWRPGVAVQQRRRPTTL